MRNSTKLAKGSGPLPGFLRNFHQIEVPRLSLKNVGQHAPSFSNPSLQGYEDVIDDILYDSVSFAQAAAFAKTTLFQTQVGQGGKTIAQTNMRQPGKMANGERFQIKGFACFVANDTVPADLNNFLRNVSVTVNIRTKPYWQSPPLMLPAGCGGQITAVAQVGTAPAGTSAVLSTSNGSLDPRATIILSPPGYPIDANENFEVILNPETAFNFAANTANPVGVGTTIYFMMFGQRYRGVS